MISDVGSMLNTWLSVVSCSTAFKLSFLCVIAAYFTGQREVLIIKDRCV